MKIGLLAIAAASLLLSNPANTAEIKVLASGAIKEAYLELIPQFEKASEHKVATTWAGTVDIKKRMAAGEVFDLVIVASPELDAFIQEGKVVRGSRADLVRSGVGVAVRAGAPKPDIGSGEALKKALLAAESIGYSTGPSGVYLASLFERMGIADQVKPKLKQTPPGVLVGSIIASGEAEIGFQQVSELIHVRGIDFLGPLPADVQNYTSYGAALMTIAPSADAAKAFLAFLSTPAAKQAFVAAGVE